MSADRADEENLKTTSGHARLVRALVVVGVGSRSRRRADGFRIGVNGMRLHGECNCGGVSSGDVGELIDGGVGGNCASSIRTEVVFCVGRGSGRCVDGFGIGVDGTQLDGECECGGVSSWGVGEVIDGGVSGSCASSVRTEVMIGVGVERHRRTDGLDGCGHCMRLDGECSCNEDTDASDGSNIGGVNDWMGLRKVDSALSCLIVDVGVEESNGSGGNRARLDGESVGGSDGEVGACDGGEGEKS